MHEHAHRKHILGRFVFDMGICMVLRKFVRKTVILKTV